MKKRTAVPSFFENSIRLRAALVGMSALVLALAGESFGQGPTAKERVVQLSDGRTCMLKSRLKSILVTNFYYNYEHKVGIPNLINTLTELGKAEGWKVDVVSDGNLVTATKLKSYQVLFGNYITNWASSGNFTNKDAVQAWVEAGGGMFIMHGSGDSKQSANWDWYYQTAHPVLYVKDNPEGKGPASAFIPAEAKSHPVMQGISFQGKDTVELGNSELHLFTHLITDIYPKAEVFLKVDGNKCATCKLPIYKTPGGYPISWSFPVSKGRVGYFMEGHDLVTMTSMHADVWNKFFKQFMYYMAGYDSLFGDPIPPRDSTPEAIPSQSLRHGFALESSGITFHPHDEAGVFISAPGRHSLSLVNLAGRPIKEAKGSGFPVDYDLRQDLRRAGSGVYVIRVTVGNKTASKKFCVP